MKFLILSLLVSSQSHAEIQLEKIKLPPGFKISVYAKDIVGARSMFWGEKGTLFVGTRKEGNVYAIERSGAVHKIAKDLNMPNGVAFRAGALYVAEIHRLIKFENIESQLSKPPEPKELISYPKDEHHGWKYISFGPDDKLYITQGVPCNICDIKDPYGTILQSDSEGKNLKVYARGIRNSVGFDFHPLTKELWFTDNGRDNMGDDLPADELNHAPKEGLHFGFPFCQAGDIKDPEFGTNRKCSEFKAPVQKLGAHVAALGMRFYRGNKFPKEYQGQVFIAEHGSWNRTKKSGYRITLVRLDDNGKAKSYEPFAEGWLEDEKRWGRPVDLINSPDGSILVSDDFGNAIYKIEYQKN